ncbi:MAG: hypothetical protein ABR567_13885 [Myxococcales bacterium]|nr:hypothetical protein [Myxococcales bacterium]
MKKPALAFAAAAFISAGVAVASRSTELNNPSPRQFPTQERFVHEYASSGAGGNLVNHGGPTITSAHVVAIFWGPSWQTADSGLASTLAGYIANYGTTGEYNVITQYSGIQRSALATDNPAVWYDTSTPPTNVTDAAIQGEASKYISQYGFDSSAIYEVFLPSSSYSSNGTRTSCGGPNLYYCAYHGNFAASVGDVKYASMPYPSCGGCQSAGFNAAQNFEHFISHETREAVTDADGTAWFDRRGYEADDKCAWSPTPFIDPVTQYAYQYEWSNANSGCVQTR